MLDTHMNPFGDDTAIHLQRCMAAIYSLIASYKEGLCSRHADYYLLVDNNTNSSLGDVPDLAGASMVHFMRHTLQCLRTRYVNINIRTLVVSLQALACKAAAVHPPSARLS
jgi:hypothetical protein